MKRSREINNKSGTRKAPCPTCKRQQNCSIRSCYLERWSDEELNIDGHNEFMILECAGCNTLFQARNHSFSEDVDVIVDKDTREQRLEVMVHWEYYPSPRWRELPKWFKLDFRLAYDRLAQLMQDTCQAANQDSLTLAAMGIRICFEVAYEALELPEKSSFAQKLKALEEARHISPRQKEGLSILIDAGSAAAHRAWEPSREEVATLFDALESFIFHSIVLPEDLDSLAKRVPKRQN